MADLTPPPHGSAPLPASNALFDRLARTLARDMSRRQTLRLAAGATATAVFGSWLHPRWGVAAGDPGCAGTRTSYSEGCAKPVAKLNYTAPFNGCGPENGVNIVPNSPLGVANFYEACKGHDICYGTCNSNKDSCDSNFFDAMKAICIKDYPGSGLFDAVGRSYCLQLARDYTTAVSLFGANAYKTGQTEGCDCCSDCPSGTPMCGEKCCPPGQECSNGHCCYPCEPGWVKCGVATNLDVCGFVCCKPETTCCPEARGIPTCCPTKYTCSGGHCGP